MATTLDTLKVQGSVSSTVQGKLVGSVGEMPAADSSSEGFVVWYLGESGEYEYGTVYRCVTDDDGVTYRWVALVRDILSLDALTDDAVRKDTTVNGHALDGDVELTAEDVGAMPASTFIPTRVSELANDGVWITQDCCTLANYYTKEQTDAAIQDRTVINTVDELPTMNISPNSFYALNTDSGVALYARISGRWVRIRLMT